MRHLRLVLSGAVVLAGCQARPPEPSSDEDAAAAAIAKACRRRGGAPAGPVWTEGRYFPTFPAASDVYVFKVVHGLNAQELTWQTAWRISDTPLTMWALTLVGMQGIINRETPCVYLSWADPVTGTGDFWAAQLEGKVTVHRIDSRGPDAIHFLHRAFADRFAGAVIYDPQIPDTINVATMIAGLEDRMILAPQELGTPGIPDFADTLDLRPLAAAEGWDTTAAGRQRLYRWVHEHLWPRLDHRIIGVASPGPPTSGGATPEDPDFSYPITLASRDYLVALRAPALWLDPSLDPGDAALLDQFLDEAPSPVPVTGLYDEVPAVALASRHGDWQAAFNFVNSPLGAPNLTVLAAVPEPVAPAAPAIDPAHILATLGSAAVVSVFTSDGDNLQYQIDRGFHGAYGLPWADLQGHRTTWTTNATLADLAPMAWNYFQESSDQLTFMASLSGAGYAYPTAMSPAQLAAYLARTAEVHLRTGIRTIWIDDRGGSGGYPQIAAAYHDALSASGYLGAVVGLGSFGLPPWGVPQDYYLGVPTPGISPLYVMPGVLSVDALLAELQTRRLGSFTIRIADWPGVVNEGAIVDDPTAPGGRALALPASLPACCLAIVTSDIELLPGDYQLSMTAKVADNGSAGDVATLFLGRETSDWEDLGSLPLHPADFDQAGQWQTFTLSFSLAAVTKNVRLAVNFVPGASDLSIAELAVTRAGVDPLPLFTPIHISLVQPGDKSALAHLPDDLAAGGVVVVTADELMAALNPEYMIDFAEPLLGASHPALAQARAQLDAGQFLDALLTVRAALQVSP